MDKGWTEKNKTNNQKINPKIKKNTVSRALCECSFIISRAQIQI